MARRPSARERGYAQGLADAEAAIVAKTSSLAFDQEEPQSLTEDVYAGLNLAYVAVTGLSAEGNASAVEEAH